MFLCRKPVILVTEVLPETTCTRLAIKKQHLSGVNYVLVVKLPSPVEYFLCFVFCVCVCVCVFVCVCNESRVTERNLYKCLFVQPTSLGEDSGHAAFRVCRRHHDFNIQISYNELYNPFFVCLWLSTCLKS